MRIFIFGDSIPFGMRDLEKGGWVDRFKVYFLNTGQFNEAFNLSNPGETSDRLVKRIKNELSARTSLEYRKDNAVIIQTGINDSHIITDKDSLRIPIDQFKENIKELIEISSKLVAKVIFVGLIPIDETKTNPIPWNINANYKNEHVKKYNDLIKSVCKEENIYFVEIFENWINSNYKKLLDDGLHPNVEGHKKLYETIKNFMIKNKMIK